MRKILKENIDCAMTYMAHISEWDLSPYDAVRIIRGALWDELKKLKSDPIPEGCLPEHLIDSTVIFSGKLIRGTNWEDMPDDVRQEFEKID